MQKAEIIAVLGMHRGGTSVVARALQALGVALGKIYGHRRKTIPRDFGKM